MTTSDSGSDPLAVSHSGGNSASAADADAALKHKRRLEEEGSDLDDLIQLAMGEGASEDDAGDGESEEDAEESQTDDDGDADEDDEAQADSSDDQEDGDDDGSDDDGDAEDQDDDSLDDDDAEDKDREAVAGKKVGRENAKLRKKLREAEAQIAKVSEAAQVGESILRFEQETGADRDTLNGYLNALRGTPQEVVANLQRLTGFIAKAGGVEIQGGSDSDSESLIADLTKNYFLDKEDVAKLKAALASRQSGGKPAGAAPVLPSKGGDKASVIATFRAKLAQEVGESVAKDLESDITAEAQAIIARGRVKGIQYTSLATLLDEAKASVLRTHNKPARKQESKHAKPMTSKGSRNSSTNKKKSEARSVEDGMAELAEMVASGKIK